MLSHWVSSTKGLGFMAFSEHLEVGCGWGSGHGKMRLCMGGRVLNLGRMTAVPKIPSFHLARSQSICLSPSMLCCGILTLLLSWASLAADAAAAVVSEGDYGWLV